MTQEDIVKKNLELHEEFLEYIGAHPEALEQIPTGAHLVFLPEDDKAFCEENLEHSKELQEERPEETFLLVQLHRVQQSYTVHEPISSRSFKPLRQRTAW